MLLVRHCLSKHRRAKDIVVDKHSKSPAVDLEPGGLGGSYMGTRELIFNSRLYALPHGYRYASQRFHTKTHTHIDYVVHWSKQFCSGIRSIVLFCVWFLFIRFPPPFLFLAFSSLIFVWFINARQAVFYTTSNPCVYVYWFLFRFGIYLLVAHANRHSCRPKNSIWPI